MIGCLIRLALGMIIGVVAGVGYLTRDAWIPRVKAEITSSAPAARKPGAAGAANKGAEWEALSPEGAKRGREALASLTKKNGPVYVNVAGSDLAAFAVDSILSKLSPKASGAQVLVKDDKLYLRSMVSVADLGGTKALGPLAGMIDGKQPMTVRGNVEVLKPGYAQFKVDEVSIGDLKLPSMLIPKIAARVAKRLKDGKVSDNGIPFRIPPEIAEVRVNQGHVTLYKVTP